MEIQGLLGGYEVNIISPEDLILSKLRWFEKSQSERHLEDAKSVLKMQKKKIDMDYLKRVAKSQNNQRLLESLLR